MKLFLDFLFDFIIIFTQCSAFDAFTVNENTIYDLYEHSFFMEPNVVINQTLYSMCLESSLEMQDRGNILDLQMYPAGVIYSHLSYLEDKDNSIEIDEYDPLQCTMVLETEQNLRIQINFQEFDLPHYEGYDNDATICTNSFVIVEILENKEDDKKVERILKLCGKTVEHLALISLDGNSFYRSLTNTVVVKWQPRKTSGKGFKSTFLIIEPMKDDGQCSEGFIRCDDEICIPKTIYCHQKLNMCMTNLYNNYENICKNAASKLDKLEFLINFLFIILALYFYKKM